MKKIKYKIKICDIKTKLEHADLGGIYIVHLMGPTRCDLYKI